jgi:hypothetical protein
MSNAAPWASTAGNKSRAVARTTDNPSTKLLAERLTALTEALRDFTRRSSRCESDSTSPGSRLMSVARVELVVKCGGGSPLGAVESSDGYNSVWWGRRPVGGDDSWVVLAAVRDGDEVGPVKLVDRKMFLTESYGVDPQVQRLPWRFAFLRLVRRIAVNASVQRSFEHWLSAIPTGGSPRSARTQTASGLH